MCGTYVLSLLMCVYRQIDIRMIQYIIVVWLCLPFHRTVFALVVSFGWVLCVLWLSSKYLFYLVCLSVCILTIVLIVVLLFLFIDSYDGGNNRQLELLCVYITNIGSSLFGISAH